MFGDDETIIAIAEEMLSDIELADILEMNDLTDLEVLTILISGGYIGQPERYLLGVSDDEEQGSPEEA